MRREAFIRTLTESFGFECLPDNNDWEMFKKDYDGENRDDFLLYKVKKNGSMVEFYIGSRAKSSKKMIARKLSEGHLHNLYIKNSSDDRTLIQGMNNVKGEIIILNENYGIISQEELLKVVMEELEQQEKEKDAEESGE